MKNRVFIIAIIFFSFLSYLSNAQDTSDNKEPSSKNYFMSNISYSNLIHNDNGSAIGIVYHRMFSDKFGANTSYSRVSTHGRYTSHYTIENNSIDKIIFGNMTSSHSINIGLTYRATAGRHELLGTAGLNYQYVYYNYIRDIHFTDNNEFDLSQVHDSFTGYGFYNSLDYLFFITKEFAVGIHGAYEHSASSLSIANAGVSLAYRF